MTKTRKAVFLSLGVAVGLAGSVAASERAREDATADGSRVAAPPADFKMTSPEVGIGTWNGKQMQVSLKATVAVADAEKESGSVERYLYDQSMRNVATVDHNGQAEQVAAVIGSWPDVGGAKVVQPGVPIGQLASPTLADFQQRFNWVERTVGGETVTLFMTPVVINDPSMMVSERAQMMSRVRSMIFKGQRVFLNGVVFTDDLGPQNNASTK